MTVKAMKCGDMLPLLPLCNNVSEAVCLMFTAAEVSWEIYGVCHLASQTQ